MNKNFFKFANFPVFSELKLLYYWKKIQRIIRPEDYQSKSYSLSKKGKWGRSSAWPVWKFLIKVDVPFSANPLQIVFWEQLLQSPYWVLHGIHFMALLPINASLLPISATLSPIRAAIGSFQCGGRNSARPQVLLAKCTLNCKPNSLNIVKHHEMLVKHCETS